MNCWLPDETRVEALKKTLHIDPSLTFDARKFNAAFAKSSSAVVSLMSRFDGSNKIGVFHVRFQHRQSITTSPKIEAGIVSKSS